MPDKKYYWLKLKRDFFKRHDMQIIEAMPNGKDYLLFYLKMLLESIDHEGALRFSDTIPYNEQMLSTITNTNIDVVRAAMKVFSELKMIDVLDDQTIYMSEVKKMVGSETYWAERKRIQNARKKANEQRILLPSGKVQQIDEARYGGNGVKAFERSGGVCEMCGSQENLCIHHNNEYSNELDDLVVLCRKCHKNVEFGNYPINVQRVSNKSKQEKEIELEKDTEIEKERKRPRFSPPSLDEVSAYCTERRNKVDPQTFIDFYESKGWIVGKTKMKDWKASVRTWEKRDGGKGSQPKPHHNPFLDDLKERGVI